MTKICIALDGSNFLFSQKDILNWSIDPGKLRRYIQQWGEVVEARYYLSVDPTSEDKRRDNYAKALYYMGYSVIPIPIKTIQTENGIKEKADADVRLAVDAILAADTFDMFVLVSGDSDFAYLLEILRSKGKLIRVISTFGIAGSELMQLAGTGFYDFEHMRKEIEKDGGH